MPAIAAPQAGTVGGMAPSYIWYPLAILRDILGVGIT
jgi:hypothetical protein